jgi:Flp pilus assembly pilin Flp
MKLQIRAGRRVWPAEVFLERNGRSVQGMQFFSIALEAGEHVRPPRATGSSLLERCGEEGLENRRILCIGEVSMVKFSAAVRTFAAGEDGASLVEYSLLVALLAAASIAILYGLGQNVKSMYTQVNNAVGTANVGITSAS